MYWLILREDIKLKKGNQIKFDCLHITYEFIMLIIRCNITTFFSRKTNF